MRLSGSRTLAVPRAQVWDALADPAVLARAVPGCEALERTAPGVCELTVTGGAASVHGTYAGTVAVADREPPERSVLRLDAAGGPGTVAAEATVELVEVDGGAGTQIIWRTDAELRGRLAGVGQHLVAAVAERTAEEFLDGVADTLAGETSAPEQSQAGQRPAPGSPGGAARAGTAIGPAVPAVDRTGPRGGPPTGDGAESIRLALAFLAGALVALLGVRVARRRRG